MSKTSKQEQSLNLDKNPVDHAGGLEVQAGRRNSWETDDTLVPGRRDSLDSRRSSHSQTKGVEIPPFGFVSERRPSNWRLLRNHWRDFKLLHPQSAKLIKWTSWLLGVAATTGGSVVLSEEIKKLYRKSDKNLTFEQLDNRVHIITHEFERLLNDSKKEIERRPVPGIFDIYFDPVERVRRGNRPDFIFDFEKVNAPTTPKREFFPNRNETYVGKHGDNVESGIVHFNDSNTTSKFNFSFHVNSTLKDSLKTQREEPTKTSTAINPFLEKDGTLITYKVFAVSNVLIVVGALTIITLAFILMCCFCYGCKSRERRYTNRDTVRARVITREPNVPNISNVLPSVKLYPYDTPQGATLNRPTNVSYANAQANANYPEYEMVDVDLGDTPPTGLQNRAFYPTTNQSFATPASQVPAVSTGQRRLISVL